MKSLTIIQETRAGLLAEITTLLERHKIDLRSVDGSTVGSLAVINLTAEPYQVCFQALTDAGFKAVKEPWEAFWGQRYAAVADPDGNQVDLFAPRVTPTQ